MSEALLITQADIDAFKKAEMVEGSASDNPYNAMVMMGVLRL